MIVSWWFITNNMCFKNNFGATYPRYLQFQCIRNFLCTHLRRLDSWLPSAETMSNKLSGMKYMAGRIRGNTFSQWQKEIGFNFNTLIRGVAEIWAEIPLYFMWNFHKISKIKCKQAVFHLLPKKWQQTTKAWSTVFDIWGFTQRRHLRFSGMIR